MGQLGPWVVQMLLLMLLINRCAPRAVRNEAYAHDMYNDGRWGAAGPVADGPATRRLRLADVSNRGGRVVLLAHKERASPPRGWLLLAAAPEQASGRT